MNDIFLMRHAKSAYPPGVPDHDRPLNERGKHNAEVAAAWLAGQRLDTVLVSSALRAQQTWAIVSRSVKVSATSIPELYEASTDTIAEVLARETDRRTLVIAHNPGLADYVMTHCQPDTSALAWSELSRKFPTSAIAHLREGVLVDFVVPR
jgi:phosphohistidine phosphatase